MVRQLMKQLSRSTLMNPSRNNGATQGRPPKISVVIPTFNRSQYLRRVIASLLAQELQPGEFEIIIIDDGSTDDTEEICKPLAGSGDLCYFRQSNQGISAAKNHGIEVARGEIVLFFDDDDLADPNLLSEHLRSHEEFPDEMVAVLGYTTWHTSIQKNPLMDYVVGKGGFLFSYGELNHGQFYSYDRFWGGRTSCKRRMLLRHGLFNPTFTFGSEDIELGYRLSRLGLKVFYNRNARSYMVRELDFDSFMKRCERQGKSQAWFSRLYSDPEVQKRCMTENAEAIWESLQPEYETNINAVHRLLDLERLVRTSIAGKSDPSLETEHARITELLESTFRQAFISAKYKGVAEELRRLRRVSGEVSPDARALKMVVEIEGRISDRLYEQAQAMTEKGDYEEAKKLLMSILEMIPLHANSTNDLAVLCSVTGDNDRAIALLNDLVRADQNNLVAWKNLGKILLQSGRLEDSLKANSSVLARSPEDIETLLTIAELCVRLGRGQDAIFFFDKALSLSKDPEIEKHIMARKKEMERLFGNQIENQGEETSHNSVSVPSNGSGRILVTSPSFPMFDRAAGSLYLFNILRILKDLGYSVTFVAVNPVLKERYEPVLNELGIDTIAGDHDAMRYFGVETSVSRIDYANFFRQNRFDYAILDFWYQAEYYVPLIRKYSPGTRIVIDTEDVHFVRETREAEVKGDAGLRARAVDNKKRELAIYRKADRLWVVTEDDKRALGREVREVPIDILPLIDELHGMKNDFENRNGILYVGNFNHTPNIDAVQFFVNEILPKVEKEIPDIFFQIVGNDPRSITAPLSGGNVRVAGYVKDLSEYYNNARIAVAPLRYGAGLKGKIVESLSYGVPTVTTKIGAEGTGLIDGEDAIISDDPGEMARKIINLYNDRDAWTRLSVNGRNKMEASWSFAAAKNRLTKILAEKPPNRIGRNKLTSIVILTYNQLEYTKITLESIRKCTSSPYEIIVVDNASSDGTVEYLKTQKNIRTIFNAKNVGFPAGCNQGMEAASGDYVLLLNNDVVVTKYWLEGLIECAESDDSIGLVGPMTNNISGMQRDPNAKYGSEKELQEFAAAYRKKNRRNWLPVNRLAGFCLLIKRKVIEEIGGLDPGFGIGNCEDDDYALRAALKGYRSVIATDVFIEHKGGGSFLADGLAKYVEILKKNEKVFSEKWGITPESWWRDSATPAKRPLIYVPLDQSGTC